MLEGLRSDVPNEFWAAGPLQPLDQPKTGFFCSSQCPGSIILKTFDAITQMRDEGQVLIGGFHAVMEWECLSILLRGRQPVIWVPVPPLLRMALNELRPRRRFRTEVAFIPAATLRRQTPPLRAPRTRNQRVECSAPYLPANGNRCPPAPGPLVPPARFRVASLS